MSGPRAIMFDMAGTVVSTSVFKNTRGVTNDGFTRILGLKEDDERVGKALATGSAKAVQDICSEPFYLHDHLFSSFYVNAAELLGCSLSREEALRLNRLFWDETTQHFMLLGLNAGLRIGALDTLRDLRSRGLHLSLISNMDEYDFRNFLGVENFGSYFDFHLSSEAAGSCKPDPGIFHQAISAAGCDPSDAMFVGDTPAHDIDGAGALGMQTVLILDDQHQVVTRGISSTHTADHVIRELPELLACLA